MKEILDLLHSDTFYGVSETVEIAKGKNELVTNFKDIKEKIKRVWKKE
jgi:hypothetical protein